MLYIRKAISLLNEEKDEIKRLILIEKIEKGMIIINEKDYQKEIDKLKDEDIKMQFSYINYKKSFLKSLEYIKNDDKKNVELAKKALNLKKIFYYNQSATIGENNYYFYKICLQLFPKINEIYQYYQLYYNLIERMISFISIENFDDLNDDQLFFFNYISEIILDKKTLTTHSQLEKINNFLFGKVVDENNVISSISEMTPYIENTDNISFDLKFDEENHKLKFIIKENNKINIIDIDILLAQQNLMIYIILMKIL